LSSAGRAGRVRVGTKSLLFGVHQVFWHPVTVWLAWRRLYGRLPSWRIAICILVHDWGYLGCRDMDGTEGEKHPELGSRIAGWLFGPDYRDLVLYHSRTYARMAGVEPSLLCWADKASIGCEPEWFYLFRARLSGELYEYRTRAATAGFVRREAPDRAWFQALTNHLCAAAEAHHA